MPLTDVELGWSENAIPADVRRFLSEAERRIEEFQQSCRVPAFIPSDFERAYAVLCGLAETRLTPGRLFCEWGSGFGVVTCLAAMLDYDAIGIEIEEDLVVEAQQLADDFELPVEFVRGSFIPRGANVETGTGFGWLTTEDDDAGAEVGLAPNDFDVIFAYPWPDEEGLTEALFERYAGKGALLVTYHGSDDFRVRRKKGNSSSARSTPRGR